MSEFQQPYSAVARQFLYDHILSNRVKVVVDSKGSYGRSLAWVYYDSKNFNIELLKTGLACHFRRYSKDKELQTLEDEARA